MTDGRRPVDRRVVLGCGASAALGALAATRTASPSPLGGWLVPGPRAQLRWESGEPVRVGQVAPHRVFVFLYPYEGTPCFLLNLGRPVPGVVVETRGGGLRYAWPGGVGADRTVVGYSAICSHAYTHPTREVAMVRYHGPDAQTEVAERSGVISCCVHGSAFDPARGALPMQPPAEFPLAGVTLEWDEASDGLTAQGMVGRAVFTEFFRNFPRSARRPVQGATTVWPLERYSARVMSC